LGNVDPVLDTTTNMVGETIFGSSILFVCWFSIGLVVFLVTAYAMLLEWRKYKKNPKGFRHGRTVVLALIMGIIVLGPAMVVNMAILERMEEERWPHLEYYEFSQPPKKTHLHLQVDHVQDCDSAYIDGRIVVVFIEQTHEWLYLKVASEWINGTSVEPATIASIGNGSYDLKARGSLRLGEEGGQLVCFYSYITRAGPSPGTVSWMLMSTDGISWSQPERVAKMPAEDTDKGGVPLQFREVQDFEIYDHRSVRTSDSGNLLFIRYYFDEGDYPDFKGIYVSYRPPHGDWSDLAILNRAGHIPETVVEDSPGHFIIIDEFLSSGFDSYSARVTYLNVTDLYDVTGPVRMV